VSEIDDVEHTKDNRQAEAEHRVETTIHETQHQLSEQRGNWNTKNFCHLLFTQ